MRPVCVCLLLGQIILGNVVDAQIFASSGSSVFLRMEFDLKRNQTGDGKCDQIEWKHENVTTTTWTRLVKPKGCLEKIKLSDRMKMSENGSLEIHNVTREDSGKYKLEIHNTRGTSVYIKEYNVTVQVPVSDPVLEVRCLSNGSAVISCRVQSGSDPEYSLSVSGVTWGNSSSAWNVSEVIIEPSYDPWNISCSVRNRISHSETNRIERNCPALQGETGKKCLVSHVVTTCFLCAAMTLLLVDIVRTLRGMDGTPEPGRPPRWKRRERTTSL